MLLTKAKSLILDKPIPQNQNDKDYLNNLINTIKKIDIALEMIKYDDKDIDKIIEMLKVNKYFVDYYSNLLKNINKIYKRFIISKYFKRYVLNCFLFTTIQEYRTYQLKNIREPKIRSYLYTCFDYLTLGIIY